MTDCAMRQCMHAGRGRKHGCCGNEGQHTAVMSSHRSSEPAKSMNDTLLECLHASNVIMNRLG